ncbi:TFIIB-type zinc finger domain-containing protein [Thermoflavimicrobium daqui]|jgi:hypothetical protein|uniref:TFIIB-type zinc finger domain-containing protein n=1 Tax=Thermoflavimicrobium daqui TaxID=2137476 RepID=UPI00143CC72B|nr:TFIIB-type zinc finger domain-containing protein [Thermoflavimicrobium daqui]
MNKEKNINKFTVLEIVNVRHNRPKPAKCARCGSTSFEWIGGEWVCKKCHMINE